MTKKIPPIEETIETLFYRCHDRADIVEAVQPLYDRIEKLEKILLGNVYEDKNKRIAELEQENKQLVHDYRILRLIKKGGQDAE